MYLKSRNCKNRHNNQPLNEYNSENEALHHANYLNNNSIPYLCKNCEKWHLAPKLRSTPSRPCTACADSSGKYKQSFASKNDAQTRATIIFKEKKVRLKIYPCPHNNGWHLTKEKN